MAEKKIEFKYCLKCGNSVPSGANFCPSCGENLKRTVGSNKKGTRNEVRASKVLSVGKFTIVIILGLIIWGIGWSTQSSLAGKKPTDTYEGLVNSKLQTLRENAKAFPEDKEALIALANGIIEKVRETGMSSPDLIHEAIDALRQILKIDPNDSFALLTMGDLSFESELYSKAIELYEKLLLQDPSNFHALASISVAYSQIGDLQKSIEKGDKALTVAPSEEAKNAFLEFFDKVRATNTGATNETAKPVNQNSVISSPGVKELVSFVQSNPIAGPKFVNHEMISTNILALRFKSFPMAAMPPFPKEKFLTGIKNKANELGIKDIKEIHFIDADSGETMEKLPL